MTRNAVAAGLDAARLREVFLSYHQALRRAEADLNALNVYPVADSDTGTNMALTMASVAGQLDDAATVPQVCEAVSRGAFMGAHGNSGLILSEVLRGLSATLCRGGTVAAQSLAEGLQAACRAAYEAVDEPVEGTMLTVAAAAGQGAAAVAERPSATLTDVLEAAAAAAWEAVAQTPRQLAVLAEAGVVDAGGKGLALLYDTFLRVAAGQPPHAHEAVPDAGPAEPAVAEGSAGRHEVVVVVSTDEAGVAELKEAWAALGDSITSAGGRGVWKCHVHTDDVETVVATAGRFGRVSDVRVTPLPDDRPPRGCRDG